MEKYSGSSKLAGIQWQSVALGAGIGVAATMIFMLIFAVVLASVDLWEGAPRLISSMCLGIGALLGGFVAAKRNCQKGLFVGLATGGAVFCAFALVALILGSDVGVMFIVRLAVAIISGAVGGVLGINLRPKRRYV